MKRAAFTLYPFVGKGLEILSMSTKKFIILFFLLLIQQAEAQFRPYSLYHLSPTLTNPALVATTDYGQVTAHYRQSKVSGYQLSSLSYVHPFYRKASSSRYGGMGFTLINQSAGPSGMYRVTGTMAGFGHDLRLSERHHLASGLQLSLLNKRIDPGAVTTDSQFGSSGYDPALATEEGFDQTSRSAVGVNSGITWYYTNPSGGQKASLGMALYNLNQPDYRFMQERNREPVAYTVTGSFLMARKGNFSVLPTFRYIRQGNTGVTTIGSQFRYALDATGESSLGAGLWLNSNGSVSSSLQLEKENFLLSFGFDASTYFDSPKAPVNNAFEAALSWRMNRKKKALGRRAAAEPVASEVLTNEQPSLVADKTTAHTSDTVTAAPKPAVEEGINSGKDTIESIPAREEEPLARKISYPLGGTELSPEDEQFLDSLATKLKQQPSWHLRIIGHTCSLGSKAANEKISLQRAQYVQQRLLQKGVLQSQLLTVGQSDRHPVASNDTETGRAWNRRVEFVFLK